MGRDRDVEAGAARAIGIDVRADIDAARPCRLDARDRLRHQLAPERGIGGLDVVDLDFRSAALADAHRLVDRGQQLVALVAHMGGVETAALARNRRQPREVARRLEGCGVIDQCGRDAEHARAHRGADLGLHRFQLVLGRRAGGVTHHLHPRLHRAIIGAEIDRDALAFERVEIGRKLGGGNRGAALARDQRGDAHAQFVDRRPVIEQRALAVVEHVDKARRDIAAARGHFLLAGPGNGADRDDLPVLDRHVARNPGIARPVEHAPAPDHDVVRRVGGGGRPQQQRRGEQGERSDHAFGPQTLSSHETLPS